MTDREDCAAHRDEHARMSDELRHASNEVCRAAWDSGWVDEPNTPGDPAKDAGQVPAAVSRASHEWARLLVRMFNLERSHPDCFPDSDFNDVLAETRQSS